MSNGRDLKWDELYYPKEGAIITFALTPTHVSVACPDMGWAETVPLPHPGGWHLEVGAFAASFTLLS